MMVFLVLLHYCHACSMGWHYRIIPLCHTVWYGIRCQCHNATHGHMECHGMNAMECPPIPYTGTRVWIPAMAHATSMVEFFMHGDAHATTMLPDCKLSSSSSSEIRTIGGDPTLGSFNSVADWKAWAQTVDSKSPAVTDVVPVWHYAMHGYPLEMTDSRAGATSMDMGCHNHSNHVWYWRLGLVFALTVSGGGTLISEESVLHNRQANTARYTDWSIWHTQSNSKAVK